MKVIRLAALAVVAILTSLFTGPALRAAGSPHPPAMVAGGAISGTVTDNLTAVGLDGVRVDVFDSDGALVEEAWTDFAGNYMTSSALPPGTYYLRTVNWLSYLDELYDDRSCALGDCGPTTGTPIVVNEGSTTSGIDFALDPGGVISGTVTDNSTGAPSLVRGNIAIVVFAF